MRVDFKGPSLRMAHLQKSILRSQEHPRRRARSDSQNLCMSCIPTSRIRNNSTIVVHYSRRYTSPGIDKAIEISTHISDDQQWSEGAYLWTMMSIFLLNTRTNQVLIHRSGAVVMNSQTSRNDVFRRVWRCIHQHKQPLCRSRGLCLHGIRATFPDEPQPSGSMCDYVRAMIVVPARNRSVYTD